MHVRIFRSNQIHVAVWRASGEFATHCDTGNQGSSLQHLVQHRFICVVLSHDGWRQCQWHAMMPLLASLLLLYTSPLGELMPGLRFDQCNWSGMRTACWCYEPCSRYRYHQYKFIVDGEWRHDETQPFMPDPLGNVNNWLFVRRPEQPQAQG